MARSRCNVIIIKGPGTSFQVSSVEPKIGWKYFSQSTPVFDQVSFYSAQDSKEISRSVTFIMQQCLCGFHKNTKIQISRKRNIVFSSNKKFINCASRAMTKNSFLVEVTFQQEINKSCLLFILETKEISIYILKQRKLCNFNRRLKSHQLVSHQ